MKIVVRTGEKMELSKYKTIGDSVFKKLNVANIDLSEVETVGNHAFRGCTGLSVVNLSKCTHLGISAFSESDVETVAIPDNCFIGGNAFKGCSNLKELHLGKNVKMGNAAFDNCGVLKLVTSETTVIPGWCFDGCTSLETVVLKGCVRIETHAFKGCSNLKEIYVDSLERIESDAFTGCHPDLKIIQVAIQMDGPFKQKEKVISRVSEYIKNMAGNEHSQRGKSFEMNIVFYDEKELIDFVSDVNLKLEESDVIIGGVNIPKNTHLFKKYKWQSDTKKFIYTLLYNNKGEYTPFCSQYGLSHQ